MNKKRRLEKILDMLKIDGTITIKEIIDELDISDMTARRDLDALEADGLLTRTHGGAQLLSSKKWNGNSFFDKFYKVQNFFPYAIPIVLDNEPPRM